MYFQRCVQPFLNQGIRNIGSLNIVWNIQQYGPLASAQRCRQRLMQFWQQVFGSIHSHCIFGQRTHHLDDIQFLEALLPNRPVTLEFARVDLSGNEQTGHGIEPATADPGPLVPMATAIVFPLVCLATPSAAKAADCSWCIETMLNCPDSARLSRRWVIIPPTSSKQVCTRWAIKNLANASEAFTACSCISSF